MVPPLIAETIHALCAIAGHENPPGRHIVGFEAVGSVKEKLKTVSEELEDFVEVSGAVDIGDGTIDGGGGRRDDMKVEGREEGGEEEDGEGEGEVTGEMADGD